MQYNFNVCGDRIKCVNISEGYSGNVNVYRCNFLLSSEWDELEAFAVFIKGGKNYVAKLSDGVCVIPWEVTESAGEFYVGIFGTLGTEEEVEKRISTNLIWLEVGEGAFCEGVTSSAPTPTIWEQYVAAMNEAVSSSEAARDEAAAAAEALETAQKATEEARDAAIVAKDEAESAKESAEASVVLVDEAKQQVSNYWAEVKYSEGQTFNFMEMAQEAQEATEGARDAAIVAKDEAESAKESAEAAASAAEESAASVDHSNFVHTTGDEEISGVKTFNDGIATNYITNNDNIDEPLSIFSRPSISISSGNGFSLNADGEVSIADTYGESITMYGGQMEIAAGSEGVKVNSDGGLAVNGDGGLVVNGNGGLVVNGKSVVTNDDDSGQLWLSGDGIDLNSSGQINLNSATGVYIDGKEAATRDDVSSTVLNEVTNHNTDASAHSDIREKLDTVEAIAEGASVSETFDNYESMVAAINAAGGKDYKKGRNINIITVGVPDLWVAYVSDTAAVYTYTTDEAFIEELEASGTVQVGYYKLAMLETQKIDLTDYAKKEELAAAVGNCTFAKVTEEEYDTMFAEGVLSADTIYFVGGSEDAS